MTTLKRLEKQAIDRQIAKNDQSYWTKGQSDTVKDVTVFARWKTDGRRTEGGYHEISYVVGAWAGASEWQAVEALGEE